MNINKLIYSNLKWNKPNQIVLSSDFYLNDEPIYYKSYEGIATAGDYVQFTFIF